MKPYWLLLLAGCGSPFSAGSVPDDSGQPPNEAMPGPADGGSDPDALEATPDVKDSGVTVDSDAADEAMPEGDSGEADAPTDVYDAGPVDTGCTPYPPGSVFCGGAPMATPTLYCVSFMYGGGAQVATPPECQCAGTYTCACILAHSSDPCAGAGTFKSCSGTTVFCD